MYGNNDKNKVNFFCLQKRWEIFYNKLTHSSSVRNTILLPSHPLPRRKLWDTLFLFWNRIQCFMS